MQPRLPNVRKIEILRYSLYSATLIINGAGSFQAQDIFIFSHTKKTNDMVFVVHLKVIMGVLELIIFSKQDRLLFQS